MRAAVRGRSGSGRKDQEFGFKQASKPVQVTDYVTQRAKIDAFYQKALSHGYVPYATRRDLDVLTINPGHAPD